MDGKLPLGVVAYSVKKYGMEMVYILVPLMAWLIAGCLKFIINSIKAGKWAWDLIGYGGMPSNHSAIVSSTAALIVFREGVEHPAFGVAVTLAFIVILDANSLRRQIGKQAKAINLLNKNFSNADGALLRERMGHNKYEIFAGIITGVLVAFIFNIYY